MPLYDYACSACGHKSEEFFKMATSSEPITCPRCHTDGGYERQVSRPHSDLIEYKTPIEMYSVAVESVEDIRRLKKECPDADISDNPDDPMYGVPICRSRKAKNQVMEASGFHEVNSERVRT